jgi:hypothetical protein
LDQGRGGGVDGGTFGQDLGQRFQALILFRIDLGVATLHSI